MVIIIIIIIIILKVPIFYWKKSYVPGFFFSKNLFLVKKAC